jgi:hypothetical protein
MDHSPWYANGTQRDVSGAQRVPHPSKRPNLDASFVISTINAVRLPP